LWLAFGLAAAPLASAQTSQGTAFTYQGRLMDGAAPANGPYDFRLALFDAAAGGSQIGPALTREDVAVADGLFTTVLDFGPVFDGRRLFLDIGVRPGSSTGAFTSLTPRQELTPAPATVFSASAPWSGVTGKPAGFADGIDNDSGGTVTSVAAGAGLQGGPITSTGSLSVAFAGSGGATTVARSDHNHDAAYVRNATAPQTGVSFNIDGTGTAGVLAAGTQFNLGADRILANPGTNNLFAGVGAGASQTTGVANTYFGASAGAANATGGSNSLFGFNAGRNTIGGNNSFFGDAAGFSNTTGGSAFFGFLAGFSNTTGSGNAFFGRQAGRSNVTGSGNSFFGDNAGFNSTGINNSFFGRNAGIGNTTGAVNSFFGEGAGANNTTGSRNVFVGREAGFANATGSDLTLVGAFANVGSDGLSFATAIGSGAVVTTSNSVVLGRSADHVVVPGIVNVGGALTSASVGTSTVNATVVNAGEVHGTVVDTLTDFRQSGERVLASGANQNTFVGSASGRDLASGSSNTFVGNGAGSRTTQGSSNTFIGNGTGLNNTGGNNNTFIGAGTGSSLPVNNSIAIGMNVAVPASNMIILGDSLHTTLIPGVLNVQSVGAGNFAMQVVRSGNGGGVLGQNVYIRQFNNPASPAHLCWRVADDGVQALVVTTCSTTLGSLRDKADVRAFTGGLDVVRRLQPVAFNWRKDGAPAVGLTAEDVAAVEPLLVQPGDEARGQEVQVERLVAVLVSAIKEQQSEIAALKRVVCASHPDASPCAQR
jgi:hypothetical protein